MEEGIVRVCKAHLQRSAAYRSCKSYVAAYRISEDINAKGRCIQYWISSGESYVKCRKKCHGKDDVTVDEAKPNAIFKTRREGCV